MQIIVFLSHRVDPKGGHEYREGKILSCGLPMPTHLCQHPYINIHSAYKQGAWLNAPNNCTLAAADA